MGRDAWASMPCTKTRRNRSMAAPLGGDREPLQSHAANAAPVKVSHGREEQEELLEDV